MALRGLAWSREQGVFREDSLTCPSRFAFNLAFDRTLPDFSSGVNNMGFR
jgi:hypothetical protein